MEISIDTVHSNSVLRTVVLIAMMAAMAACSNAPTSTPWKQADDSPWSNKHKSNDSNTYGNSASTEKTMSDPVLIAEKQPAETELVSSPPEIIEPEPVVKAAVVAVADEPLSSEQQVLAMNPSAYAVQVYASSTADNTEKFKADKALQDLMVVQTKPDGKTVYVLIDTHNNLAEARQAAKYLAEKAGTTPWVRPMSGLQKIIELE